MKQAGDTRVWRYLLAVLLLMECAPLWLIRNFPSQDGPSHVHNADVLGRPGTPIYREYYRVELLQPAGNLLTEVVLAGLIRIAGPPLGETILLTAYVILFFASFRYFLGALTPYADCFACFGAVLAPNFFLYMGFWNFAVSVCLTLLLLGYCQRRDGRWSAASAALMALGGIALYMTHLASWAVCVMAVGILSWRGRMGPAHAIPVACLLPPAALAWIYVSASSGAASSPPHLTLLDRVRPLFTLSFLYTVSDTDRWMARAVALCLVALAVPAIAAAWRRRSSRGVPLLVAGAACAVSVLFIPDEIGAGSYIHRRATFFGWIFVFAWIAATAAFWPRRVLRAAGAAFCVLAAAGLALRWPAMAYWSDRMEAVRAIGQRMRPESTALILNLEVAPGAVNPYQHAIGLLTDRAIVDIGNYEAGTDHFPTRFRPEVEPFAHLGTPDELEMAPPRFDIARYEARTRGRVDYVLFQGPDSAEEARRYPEQMARYRLIETRDGGRLRLYERRPGIARRGDVF